MKRFIAALSTLALILIPGPLRSADAVAPPSYLGKVVFQHMTLPAGWSSAQLFTMNKDGTGVRQVTSDGANSAPVWSPSGKSVAFFHSSSTTISDTAIQIMDAATGQVHTVTPDPCEGGTYDRVGWSPDSTQLVFATNCGGTGPTLSKVNVDGTGLQTICTFPLGSSVDGPSWSPDGSTIAFSYSPPATQPLFNIYSVSPNGGSLTQLTNGGPGGAYSPSYSPDGSQIAYDQSGRTGVFGIYVMDPDGANPRQLTQFGKWSVLTPSWSPEGNHVIFSSTDPACDGCGSATWDIFTARVSKPAFKRLTLFPSYTASWFPTWQPAQPPSQ
jgi:Tol biopolymer transport system component